MADVLSVAELPGSKSASRFEGRDYGASISFFVTRTPPGSGATLHRHPYEETFIVREGKASFTVGDENVEVEAGQILIVPGGTAHGFVNSGDQTLKLVSIHPSDHVVMESLAE